MSFSYAEWPPVLSESQVAALTLQATTYALSHGVLYLPVGDTQPVAPMSAIHAPISLFPSPVPRKLFEQAQKLQGTYNALYARIALDTEFLDQVMGAEKGVGQVDEFVGQLWKGWKTLRDEGLVQPIHLGLFRSDYLLHNGDALKQVEFNTISSSFGTLSERTAGLHRYLHASTDYFGVSHHLRTENFPPNETIAGLAEGLAKSHEAYAVPGSRVLFVVQAGERNVFDQRWLEYHLLEKHSILVIRQTLDELQTSASLDDSTRALRVLDPQSGTSQEISTVYFRAGYTPTDFPTTAQYTTRFLLERSLAIKCPTLPLQLAGGKKVQQVLTQPGVLERFLHDVAPETLAAIRESWMGMWGLDEPEGLTKARENALSLVLKPQREGGGNNVYKESIPSFLVELPVEERPAWIAMELIEPPEDAGNYLVRSGGDAAVRTDVVSELGIFGYALFAAGEELKEKEVGWLVRTKGKDSNEGGVAAGFSVLDSVLLIDSE